MTNPLRRRIVPIAQSEQTECGPACLAMLLAYHGCGVPLAELRERCGTSRDGTNAAALLGAARSYGMTGHGCRVGLDGLAALETPAILHWNLSHFVVLESFSQQAAVIVDPAVGRRTVTATELDRSFSGVAIELSKGPGFRRRKSPSLSYRRYRAALLHARGPLGYVLLSNAMGQVLALSHPAATQFFIDQVIAPARRQWILPVAAALVACTLAQLALGALRRKSEAVLHASLGLELAVELGSRLLALPLTFLDTRSRGDLISRVQMQDELRTIAARASQSFFDLLLVLMLGGLMLAYHRTLGLLAASLIAARLWVVRLCRAQASASHQAEILARARADSALMEATAHPEMVKGLGLETRVGERYQRRALSHASFAAHADFAEKRITRTLSLLNGTTEAALLGVGGYFTIQGELTLGAFAGFIAIRQLIEAPLASVVAVFEELGELRSAFERSDEILCTNTETQGARDAERILGQIELRDVGFRYGHGGAWVVRHVNMTVAPGEHVVIVGPSGAGKSTLLKLLCGVIPPTEGEVLLDGVSLHDYTAASLRDKIGVVLQEPLILPGTVEEALRLRVPDASRAELARAAQLALLQPMLARLPAGFSSRLAAGGVNLAGGERQRLALAQALVGGPSVLLLDEATCALDQPTEAHLLDNLQTLRATTIIAIAHKPAVIERAARLIVVDCGQVDEVTRTPISRRRAARSPRARNDYA